MATFIKHPGRGNALWVDCSVERLIETYIIRGFLVASTTSFEVGTVAYLSVLMQSGNLSVALSDCPLGEHPPAQHPDGLMPPVETESYENVLRKTYGLD